MSGKLEGRSSVSRLGGTQFKSKFGHSKLNKIQELEFLLRLSKITSLELRVFEVEKSKR